MLEKLSVENFKCFRERKDFEFGKINLLLGPNSSGKSSVMYAVLGAVQNDRFPFEFDFNGRFVNLGDFAATVNRHDATRDFVIAIAFGGSLPMQMGIRLKGNHEKLPNVVQASILTAFSQTNLDPDLGHFVTKFKLLGNASSVSTEWNYHLRRFAKRVEEIRQRSKHPLESVAIQLHRVRDYASGYTDPNDTDELSQLKYVTADFLESIGKIAFSSIGYVGQSRNLVGRTFDSSANNQGRIGRNGEGFFEQIVAWEREEPKKFEELIRQLRQMELLHEIKPRKVLGNGLYELMVRLDERGVENNLTDVGFGVSQFLPIMVADLQLPDDGTLFVAEPEIHLHPSIQANYADHLTRQVMESKRQYVVETHSEYLLNRLRLNITKGMLQPDDLRIYFLEPDGEGTAVHPITFTKDGQIQGAPETFFKTYYTDVMDIAMYAIAE